MQSKLKKNLLTAYASFQWLVFLLSIAAICYFGMAFLLTIALGYADAPYGTPIKAYVIYTSWVLLFLTIFLILFISIPISAISTKRLLENKPLTKLQKISSVLFIFFVLPLFSYVFIKLFFNFTIAIIIAFIVWLVLFICNLKHQSKPSEEDSPLDKK